MNAANVQNILQRNFEILQRWKKEGVSLGVSSLTRVTEESWVGTKTHVMGHCWNLPGNTTLKSEMRIYCLQEEMIKKLRDSRDLDGYLPVHLANQLEIDRWESKWELGGCSLFASIRDLQIALRDEQKSL